MVRGMPVSRYLETKATEVTFITMTPTSEGSPGKGTSRPVQVSMSTFSAPWGYRQGRVLTSMAGSSMADFILAMASGLLPSMPMTHLAMFRCFITALMPLKMKWVSSIIQRLSEVI